MICRLSHVLLLAAAASAAGRDGGPPPRAHQLDDSYTFEQYLSHFDKSYDDPAEYRRRAAVFARNMEKILRHNAGRMTNSGDIIDKGYVMGVNQFTDVEKHELPMGYNKRLHPAWRAQLVRGGAVATERLLGATDTDTTTTTSYSQPPAFEMEEVSALPPSVDWAADGKVNPTVPNQGGCGSCWTFAAVATIESQLSIATGEAPMDLSEQNMLQCSPNPDHCGGEGACTGATAELAYNYIADQTAKEEGGVYTLDDVPYNPSGGECADLTEGKSPSVGITGWTQLPANDYKATMNAVAKVGPLALAVAGGEWAMYEKGVFDEDDSIVNHAVVLVGYGVDEDTGEKYYKIRNSWGPNFGEDGYIRIKRTDDDDMVCEMDSDPLVGIACALDDNGNQIAVEPVKVCGKSAILFDVAYPVGAYHMD